jgi:hypothetical protein
MNVLVDTPVWSLAYRRSAKVLDETQRQLLGDLRDIACDGRAQMLGLVRQELLSGLRDPAQFERLRRLLRAFHDLPVTADDHEEAARMSNACRAKGVAGSIVDFLICAVAARRDWPIFTLDRDFELYTRHLPIKLFRSRPGAIQ